MRQSDIVVPATALPPAPSGRPLTPRLVHVLDEDRTARLKTVIALRGQNFVPRPYLTPQDLLDDLAVVRPGCILVGALGADFGVLALLRSLGARLADYPVVIAVPPGDVSGAVQAMKLGASDVIETAMDRAFLSMVLGPVFDKLERRAMAADTGTAAKEALSVLSPREYDILRGLVEGLSSKQIAAILHLNVRTIELSRSKMMQRLQVPTLSAALGMAFRAQVAPLSRTAP